MYKHEMILCSLYRVGTFVCLYVQCECSFFLNILSPWCNTNYTTVQTKRLNIDNIIIFYCLNSRIRSVQLFPECKDAKCLMRLAGFYFRTICTYYAIFDFWNCSCTVSTIWWMASMPLWLTYSRWNEKKIFFVILKLWEKRAC